MFVCHRDQVKHKGCGKGRDCKKYEVGREDLRLGESPHCADNVNKTTKAQFVVGCLQNSRCTQDYLNVVEGIDHGDI